ncbi:MAG: phosphoribosyltransferase family protein [Leptothrix sp. (in: b-proteobacteria)]
MNINAKPSTRVADTDTWIGYKKDKIINNLSYEKISNIILAQEPQQKQLDPGLVVGIARGGIVPATMVATNLSLPMSVLSITRGIDDVSWLHAPSQEFLDQIKCDNKSILLVDDIMSSGRSISKAKAFLSRLGLKVFANVVFYDQHCPITPDIGLSTKAYIKFPWERKENTPGSIAAKSADLNENFRFSQEVDFHGFDLDGVFTADLHPDVYAEDLQIALDIRDNQPLLPNAPNIPPELRSDCAIITGRPQSDHQRTLDWLNKNGLHNITLYCRDQDRFDHTTAGAIQSKIEFINSIGVSKYIESELQQAIAIATAIPSIELIWWNDGQPVTIHASTRQSLF